MENKDFVKILFYFFVVKLIEEMREFVGKYFFINRWESINWNEDFVGKWLTEVMVFYVVFLNDKFTENKSIKWKNSLENINWNEDIVGK